MGCKPSKEKSTRRLKNKQLSRSLTTPSNRSSPGAHLAKVLYRLTSQKGQREYKSMVDESCQKPVVPKEKKQNKERICRRCKSSLDDEEEELDSEGLPLLLEKDSKTNEGGESTSGWNRKEWLNMSAGVSCKVKKACIAGVSLLYANPLLFGKLIKQNVRLPDGYHTYEEFNEFMTKYSRMLPYWSVDEEGWSIVMDKKMVEESQAKNRDYGDAPDRNPWPLLPQSEATIEHFIASRMATRATRPETPRRHARTESPALEVEIPRAEAPTEAPRARTPTRGEVETHRAETPRQVVDGPLNSDEMFSLSNISESSVSPSPAAKIQVSTPVHQQKMSPGLCAIEELIGTPTKVARFQSLFSTPSPTKRQLLTSSPSKQQPVTSSTLDRFKALTPPGGEKTVVFYFTSLQGIRETHEQCKNVKRVLDGLFVFIDERDISMALEFRKELKDMLGKLTVPSVFIKGRYIGGADEVLELNEDGQLKVMVEDMPKHTPEECKACGSERFIPCFLCNGSKKQFGTGTKFITCEECNENGLLRCPLCSRG